MNLSEIKEMSVKERFLHWVRERHQTYLRRQAGLPKPWTEDPIIQTVFFTNVHRENDRVTRWYRDNVRIPYNCQPAITFATICFRWFNWPLTGEVLLGGNHLQSWNASWPRTNLLLEWDLEVAMNRLKALRNQGEQVFTGAFNISNSGSTKDKISRVCEDYVQPAWVCRHHLFDRIKAGSLELAHRALMELPGLGGGGFMAAQVVADLKYTYVLDSARDWWTWCSPGPGSIKGLNRFLRRPPDAPTPKNFLEHINRIREWIGNKLPHMPRLHSQDVQNCFCEWGKYESVLEGARPKRRYHGIDQT